MKSFIGQRAMLLLLLLLPSTAKAFLPSKNPIRTLALVRTLSSTTASATTSTSASMVTHNHQSPSQRLADTSTSYAHVVQKLQQVTHLNQAKSLLSYDQLVFMPKAASVARGAQMSALASVIHELTTSAELKHAIKCEPKFRGLWFLLCWGVRTVFVCFCGTVERIFTFERLQNNFVTLLVTFKDRYKRWSDMWMSKT